jgi:dTDP-4-amino-4,6-dideoxygalactose transaminase
MSARPVGGFGAAGLYSFDKGKNITSIEGGALVAGAALRPHVEAQYAALAPTRVSRTMTTAAKLLLYSVMLRPRAYGLMNKLPLGLGATPWEDDYALARYSPVLAAVTWRLFGRLPALTHQRRENARRLTDALQDCEGVELPAVLPTAEPAWARFPILLDATRRAAAIAALNGAGIGATASYPRALCDVPQVQAMIPAMDREQPGARDIAARIVTLPPHAYVPVDLGRTIRTVLARAA